jgi:hypothetical protein
MKSTQQHFNKEKKLGEIFIVLNLKTFILKTTKKLKNFIILALGVCVML